VTTINFGQVLKDAKSASFEALPIGDYDVEVTKAEAVTSSNGRPMIKATFKVIVGPHTNRQVMNNFVLSVDSPVALSIFFRHMKCFGLDDNFFAMLGESGTLDPAASAMVGKRVRLELGHREWQGEMRNEVKQVKPYTGAPGGMGGPAAGPQGLTGVPSPGPAAYGAVPTPGPAPVSAPMPTPTPAPAPVAATLPPVATLPPQVDVAAAAAVGAVIGEAVAEAVASQPEVAPPAPPALPI
jgi:hypothetical protein